MMAKLMKTLALSNDPALKKLLQYCYHSKGEQEYVAKSSNSYSHYQLAKSKVLSSLKFSLLRFLFCTCTCSYIVIYDLTGAFVKFDQLLSLSLFGKTYYCSILWKFWATPFLGCLALGLDFSLIRTGLLSIVYTSC